MRFYELEYYSKFIIKFLNKIFRKLEENTRKTQKTQETQQTLTIEIKFHSSQYFN